MLLQTVLGARAEYSVGGAVSHAEFVLDRVQHGLGNVTGMVTVAGDDEEVTTAYVAPVHPLLDLADGR
ncbi:hypothetical protein ACWDBD_12385 [Streptomyces sp. NPDC001118]